MQFVKVAPNTDEFEIDQFVILPISINMVNCMANRENVATTFTFPIRPFP